MGWVDPWVGLDRVTQNGHVDNSEVRWAQVYEMLMPSVRRDFANQTSSTSLDYRGFVR